MTCPRCNSEWDVTKSPCPRCGLMVRMQGRLSRSNIPQEQQNTASQSQQTGLNAQQNNGFSSRQPSGNFTPSTPRIQGNQPNQQTPQSNVSSGQEKRTLPPFPNVPQTPAPQQNIPQTPPFTQNYFPRTQADGYQQNANGIAQSPFPVQQSQYVSEQTSIYTEQLNSPPNTPRPRGNSSSDNGNNSYLTHRNLDGTQDQGSFLQVNNQSDGDRSIVARNGSQGSQGSHVPQRPQVQPTFNSNPSIFDNPSIDTRSSLPTRPTADVQAGEELQRMANSAPLSMDVKPFSAKSSSPDTIQLVPGTILRGGRYRLRELRGRQDWLDGVYEATWIAQDAQRSGSFVIIREVVTPDSSSMVMQATLRNATMALTSSGRHPSIPTLWDAFSDLGRSFFVFEPIEGQSLASRMRRSRRVLSEQEVIACCIQMTEILEVLSQQSPPLVHGLVQPENILMRSDNSNYTLTNFSIILAGGATQYIMGIDRSRLSPYAAPELARGMIDGRADLYSLMATAYYAVTGSVPVNNGSGILQAQRLNLNVSSDFEAILSKGLRPIVLQRYQRPAELRQDLLALNLPRSSVLMSAPLTPVAPITTSTPETRKPEAVQTASNSQSLLGAIDNVSKVLPSMMSTVLVEEDAKSLLPLPEELPPVPVRNDTRIALFWIIGILLFLIIVIVAGRGCI